LKIFAAVLLLACGVVWSETSRAQEEPNQSLPIELTAAKKLFAGIGPGLRAVKRGADGRMYVLASPNPGLVVFDKDGKQILTIGTAIAGDKETTSPLKFGEDCDIDSSGRIYLADRSANAVEIFSPTGALLKSIAVAAPVSIAVLSPNEVAVATLRDPHLVLVFDQNGREIREFGEPEQFSDREDLNRFLNIGMLEADAKGRLYYGFAYAPEPTVREFDQNGYTTGADIQFLEVEAAPEAQAVRREIQLQEKRNRAPVFKRVTTGVGVDATNGEVWVALHNALLHFDKDGTRVGSYLLYTPEGARLEANSVVIERDHLIVGGDPQGVYEFDRTNKTDAKK
jgi:hypothetical protein